MDELFSRIELDRCAELMPLLCKSRFVDLGFTGLYYCAEAFDICFARLYETLCLRIRGGEGFAYVLSDTARLREICETLLQDTQRNELVFDFVKEEDLQKYKELAGYAFETGAEDKYSDYFTSRDDYVALDKRAALHKYKDYNQFCRRYSHAEYEITSETLPVARALLDEWCAARSCADCTTGCEKQWILRLFDAWAELPAKGLIVEAEGKPAGFCVLEQNGDTVLRLVSKPSGKQRGLQVFMGVESVKRLFPDAKYVNMGPDSGVEGLRMFKDKFRPYTKLKKYRITLTRS